VTQHRPIALHTLLRRGDDAHRPSLENRVAFQWATPFDTLGFRNGRLRDDTILRWAAQSIGHARPASVVELGCAYGNMLFMLAALMERDASIRYVGLDLDENALEYGRAFAEGVDGYQNCEFRLHDITTALPLQAGSARVVIAADVLEHLTDIRATLREAHRVLEPGGALVLSTPLADSVFKRLAAFANRISRGATYRSYYRGKGTEIGEDGRPLMVVPAGHDHVSELRYAELTTLLESCGFAIDDLRLSPVMSGSEWFDEHLWLLSALTAVEALHMRLARPSWAHGVVVRLSKQG
jgi:SAM-dependent methyltransferase